MRLASPLGPEWRQNPIKGGMRGLSLGHIPLPGVAGAKVEILGKILGADAEMIRKTAYVESYRGHRFKVINPFLLYQTKGSNLVRIPQQREAGTRPDAKQFAITGLVVREVLREFAAQPQAERALVKACGRLLEFWLGADGAALVRGGVARPREILPIQELENHSASSAQNFVTKRLPHFERQLADRISRVPPAIARKVELARARAGQRPGPRAFTLTDSFSSSSSCSCSKLLCLMISGEFSQSLIAVHGQGQHREK